jgi:hypothetical protein
MLVSGRCNAGLFYFIVCYCLHYYAICCSVVLSNTHGYPIPARYLTGTGTGMKFYPQV